MGANQSVNQPPTANQSLYDLLDTDRTADQAELKRAYRRVALQLHPDRNFGKEEEATAQFAKVQAAYDILSDDQERKWYDEHEDSFGYTQYNAKVTKTSEVLAYMSPDYARTLDPTKDAMYRLASEFFERLKHEEMEAAFESTDKDNSELAVANAPVFGHIDAPWATVKQFYDVWSGFSTVKSFSWEEVYPVHCAPDRRTKRHFENQNKRIRNAAKRDFNKAVRALVTALRAKDIRVQRQKQTRERDTTLKNMHAADNSRAQAKKAAENRSNYVQQDWETIEEEATGDEILECIACEEVFSSQDELHAHELKPRHMRAVKDLKRAMLEDELLMNRSQKEDKKEQSTPPPASLEVEKQNEGDENLPDVENLTVDDIVNQMEKHKKGRTKQGAATATVGKAKKKRKNRQAGATVILRCGTCQMEFTGGDSLQEHKAKTRH